MTKAFGWVKIFPWRLKGAGEGKVNHVKTGLLLLALTFLFVWFGNLIGGTVGMVYALVIAGVMNFIFYFFSDRLILMMHHAQEVSEEEAPELHAIVERLAQRAGMPKPRVYIIPTETPNAFATGRSPHHSAVAVTQGILRLLNRSELEGVIAHELAHIKNRDTLIMVIAATIAGAIAVLARIAFWGMLFGGDRDREGNPLALLLVIIGMVVLPIAAVIIQLAISRAREFLADEGGAYISGKPLALASALAKLERGVQFVPMENPNPATAHLFIVSPFVGDGGSWFVNLFRTHPPTEERIARLQALALQMERR